MSSNRTKAIVNISKVVSELQKLNKASETVVRRTMNDIKTLGPGWVAKGVSQEYNIKAKNVTGGKLVKMRAEGDGFKKLKFKYSGRMLTPVHFNMKPETPKSGAYTIKATIKKGKRATIGKVKKITKKQRQNIGRNFHGMGTRNSPKSPPMLAYTGNKREGGVDFIPFQRTKQPGMHFDHVIRTISVPQMIQDGRGQTKPAVRKELNENIQKRFDHYISRHLGG